MPLTLRITRKPILRTEEKCLVWVLQRHNQASQNSDWDRREWVLPCATECVLLLSLHISASVTEVCQNMCSFPGIPRWALKCLCSHKWPLDCELNVLIWPEILPSMARVFGHHQHMKLSGAELRWMEGSPPVPKWHLHCWGAPDPTEALVCLFISYWGLAAADCDSSGTPTSALWLYIIKASQLWAGHNAGFPSSSRGCLSCTSEGRISDCQPFLISGAPLFFSGALQVFVSERFLQGFPRCSDFWAFLLLQPKKTLEVHRSYCPQ